jgi:hypothetical protein
MTAKKDVCSLRQTEFLLNAVNKLVISKFDWNVEKMPARIAAHEKSSRAHAAIVSAWSRQQDRRSDIESRAWNLRILAAKKAIHFGTPQEAMEAVERLQKDYPGSK